MVQNRNKLLDSFIGNIANTIVHTVLLQATDDEYTKLGYKKEVENSLTIAKRFRDKINPINKTLSAEDQAYLKQKISQKAKTALLLRKEKGYKNINLEQVELTTEKYLKETRVL